MAGEGGEGQTDFCGVISDPGALRFVKAIVEFGLHMLSSVILLKFNYWCRLVPSAAVYCRLVPEEARRSGSVDCWTRGLVGNNWVRGMKLFRSR